MAWRAPGPALEEARRTGKPILYDFTAAWCPPCKRMAAEVFGNPADAALINERCVPVRVMDRKSEDGRNSPEIEALQKRYGVNAFPMLVIVGADGRKPVTLRGYGSAESTRNELRAALTGGTVTEKRLEN